MSSVPDNSAAPEHAVEIAYSYLGLPYVFGGGDLDGPTNGGFDRAGFTRRVVYAATGTDIGRTLDVQLDRCTRLPAGEIAQPGDILFWTSPGGFQRVHQQAFYTGMMTVIALIPEDLVTPGGPVRHPRDRLRYGHGLPRTDSRAGFDHRQATSWAGQARNHHRPAALLRNRTGVSATTRPTSSVGGRRHHR